MPEDLILQYIRTNLFWILSVKRPFQGVISYVFSDFIHFIFITDDVVVVISLPNRNSRGFVKQIDLSRCC